MSAFEDRISGVRSAIASTEAQALLVTNLTNVRYLTGFSGTNGQVLVTQDSATFFSDPRYAARAADVVTGADVVIYASRLSESLPGLLHAHHVDALGIESNSTTISDRDDLAARLEGVRLISLANVVEELRRTKDADEVRAIEAAVSISDRIFDWSLQRIAPGIAERELALELEVEMRRSGADAVAFEPIVGSGPLSAHIHHTPSDRVFEKGDLVLMDFGCKVDGYCSDLTRTVVLGGATDDQLRYYELVLKAQTAGIAAVGVDKSGRDVDAAARAIIDTAGFAERFAHGLGHGVGLDIHEAPRLHKVSEDVLRAGDVVTIEPGVYLPDEGGIRIEDCVLVTAGGARVLGSASKDKLIEV